jgi:hypothetical protein
MTAHTTPPFVAGNHRVWRRKPAKQAEQPPCD